MDKKAGWISAMVASILFIVTPAAAQSSIVGDVIEDGLRKITFEVPAGKVKVFLPDDADAGGTISGTVVTEPNGKDPKQRSKNQALLGTYGIDLGDGTTVRTDQPSFTWVPQSLPASPLKYEIRLVAVFAKDGKTPKTQHGPIIPEPLNPAKKSDPTAKGGPIIPEPLNPAKKSDPTAYHGPIIPEPLNPAKYTIPPLGQTGRNVSITGTFDGDSSNTGILVGGTSATVIAESTRKAIFRSPTDAVGPTTITMSEGDTHTTFQFRNLRIDLTALKTTLLKGESTELHLQVSGLEGITSPVPVQMVTTGSANMQGGNIQTIQVQPSQVTPTGTFSQTFGLTGTSTGNFGVTGTVQIGNPSAGPAECSCTCRFNTPEIQEAGRTGEKSNIFQFKPNAIGNCNGNGCAMTYEYEWGMSKPHGSKIEYEIVVSDKPVPLSLKVTKAGDLTIDVTVTVHCDSSIVKSKLCKQKATKTFTLTPNP